MIDPKQLRYEVVRPSLEWIGLYSKEAEDLLMGTAAQESRLQYLKQLGTGPALGIFQMEPATHDDIWDNYLAFHPDLASQVRGLASQHKWTDNPARELVGNMMYAAAMSRVFYRRVKAALPEQGDVAAMARYWKRYYNTPLGAGTEAEFVRNYRLVSEG